MRNQGGGVGISIVTTMLARRAQAHQVILASHITAYHPAVLSHLEFIQNALASHSGTVLAGKQALGLVYRAVVDQAVLLAYIDNFRWLALVSVACLVGVAFLKKMPPHKPGLVH
jgi:DHA2 family multidrug resistance protein